MALAARYRRAQWVPAGWVLWVGLLAALAAPADAGPGGREGDQKSERAAAIRQTIESIDRQVADHGGSWEAWAESLKPYRDDIRPCVTDWQTFKWPWPAKDGFVFQGAAIQMQLLDSLDGLPEGEDPFASLVHFDRQLKALGVDLIIAFIPSKLSVYPDYLYAAVKDEPQRPARAPEDRQVSVATKRLMKRLLEADVEVVDLHEAFRTYRKAHGDDEPTFYVRDSHFLNRGARITAEAIAERLTRYDFVQEALAGGSRYTGKPGSRSDGSKADPDVLYVVEADGGRPYRDARDSPVVIAGDSYLLYNQPTGHLPAQVARLIGLPTHSMGQVGLSSNIPVQVAKDPFLPQRRVIVCAYTERALAPSPGKSKWPVVDLPGAKATAAAGEGAAEEAVWATGTVAALSAPPDPKGPYPDYCMAYYLKDLAEESGKPVGSGEGVAVVLAMRGRQVLPVAATKFGDRLTLKLMPWRTVEKRYGALQTGTLEDVSLELGKARYWGEVRGQAPLTDEELKRAGEEDNPANRTGSGG